MLFSEHRLCPAWALCNECTTPDLHAPTLNSATFYSSRLLHFLVAFRCKTSVQSNIWIWNSNAEKVNPFKYLGYNFFVLDGEMWILLVTPNTLSFCRNIIPKTSKSMLNIQHETPLEILYEICSDIPSNFPECISQLGVDAPRPGQCRMQ